MVWAGTLAIVLGAELLTGADAGALETREGITGLSLESADYAWEALQQAHNARTSQYALVGKTLALPQPGRGAHTIASPHPGHAESWDETEPPPGKRAREPASPLQFAQFALPPRTPQPVPGGAPRAPDELFNTRYAERPITQTLEFQYSYGSESAIEYRRNSDLNSKAQDNFLYVIPQVNGLIVYRPTDWVAFTLEMILDQAFPVQEPQYVTLPSGQLLFPPKSKPSLLVDQGYVTIRRITDPLEFNLGRRNYEDNRHWLYDTSLDVFRAQLKVGHFQFEASGGRQALWNLDVLQKEVKDRINTYIFYGEYRGIEDVKLGAYAIRRYDYNRQDGRPLNLGLRALGTPSDRFKYWAELAFLRGRDERSNKFRGHAIDVGGTYKLKGLPWEPNFTLGYAYGSGDGNPDDGVNNEFRQTGLESNEDRWAGLAKFKYYGEWLDPQLSNLEIFTVGFGFRPAPTVTVDLVYHWYQLNQLADSVAGPVTAVMNQDDTQLSKKVGREFDVVIGIRNVLGIRRLGIDLRMGWFYPGKAFRIEGGDPSDPTFRGADRGVSVIAKFWY